MALQLADNPKWRQVQMQHDIAAVNDSMDMCGPVMFKHRFGVGLACGVSAKAVTRHPNTS